LKSARNEFQEKFGPAAANLAVQEGRWQEFNKAKIEAYQVLQDLVRESGAKAAAEPCPICGSKMVKRHDRNGRPFWGCTGYPKCKGSRDWNPQK